MAPLQPGDNFPEGVTFSYVPYTEEKAGLAKCGRPISLDVSKEWGDKKVVLFAVPGAFTPGCSERHLPGYITNLQALKSKGVDIIAVLASNDPFVMNGWSKANGIKNDEILFLTDTDAAFSSRIGWSNGAGKCERYVIVIEGGKVLYAAKDEKGVVDVSAAETVLSKL